MKIIIMLILTLLISGCTIKNNNDNNIEENKEINKIENKEEIYQDENEVKLSIFLYDNNYSNKSRIEDTYYTDFISGTDIGSFEIFLTDDKIVDGTSFKSIWNKYYNNYSNIENHKIGFNIKFILNDGTNYNSNYLEPNTYKFGEYFYTYLYDDIHQNDQAYYSHIENMTENTLLTSIKIYATDNIEKVENIILSAFTYDSEDDFDEEGNYRGNSIYVIRIKRK